MPVPTPYENLAEFLAPGHPKEILTSSMQGNVYVYIGPTGTLQTNKPLPTTSVWEDGRTVDSVNIFEHNAASGISEMTIQTAETYAPADGGGAPTLEKTTYGLRWRPVQKPLEVHPAFGTGGESELDEVAFYCIMGWRAELDSELRSQLKFKQLDSEGSPGLEVDISAVSPNAAEFINLLLKGVEEYVDYLPVWRRRRIYRGQNAPNAGACGSVETPSGPIPSVLTSDYYFVKSADDVESIGDGDRWRQDEEWEGATQVFADRLFIYPSGIPS